jgi:(2Fe-2S) ferredoxin
MSAPRRHLLVCTNRRDPGGKPSCAARGSEALLDALKAGLKASPALSASAWITKSGCLKHCSQGPAAVLWPEGLVLAGLRPEDAPRLLERCLGRGDALPDRLPDERPWE